MSGDAGLTRRRRRDRVIPEAERVKRELLVSPRGLRHRQEPNLSTIADHEPVAEVGDLAADRLDHGVRGIRSTGVEPLVVRHQVRPVTGQVLEEMLARAGSAERRSQLAAGTTRPSPSTVAARRRERSSAPGTWSRA